MASCAGFELAAHDVRSFRQAPRTTAMCMTLLEAAFLQNIGNSSCSNMENKPIVNKTFQNLENIAETSHALSRLAWMDWGVEVREGLVNIQISGLPWHGRLLLAFFVAFRKLCSRSARGF